MNIKPLIELTLLAAIWGASFIFMKIGGPDFGPILFMAMRTLVASLFLLPLVYLKKQQYVLVRYSHKIFIVGLLNTAIPFVLFGWATLSLNAGNTAVLNGTTPMFGAIVAYFWLKDKLSLSAIIGLGIGFIGVYFLMFDKITNNTTNTILPTLAVMLAAFFYGLSANYTKKYLQGISPFVLAAGSQISATLVLLPISMFYLPSTLPNNSSIMAVIALGIICTAIAYIMFFRLIDQIGPAKTISVTYLIPIFGIIWGVIFLDESVTLWTFIGGGLIFTGVALTTGVFNKKQLVTKTKSAH